MHGWDTGKKRRKGGEKMLAQVGLWGSRRGAGAEHVKNKRENLKQIRLNIARRGLGYGRLGGTAAIRRFRLHLVGSLRELSQVRRGVEGGRLGVGRCTGGGVTCGRGKYTGMRLG